MEWKKKLKLKKNKIKFLREAQIVLHNNDVSREIKRIFFFFLNCHTNQKVGFMSRRCWRDPKFFLNFFSFASFLISKLEYNFSTREEKNNKNKIHV